MYFWIFAAALTVIAVLAVITPLLRPPKQEPAALDYDKALYKDRLKEIDRDLSLGRISSEEAENARAEEGRKLIALSKMDGAETAEAKSGKKAPVPAILAGIVAIPLAAIGVYSYLGNPAIPDQPLAARQTQAPEGQSITELVGRAEKYLADNSDDANGWAVLAPVYARLGRFEDSAKAWENVYRINPDHPEIRATLGESLMGVSQGVVTERARKLFAEELEINPGSYKARFYLAMALGQEGKNEEAASAWQELIDVSPKDAGWIESARTFRDQARAAAGLPAIADAPAMNAPGPTQEQVAAASEMTADERQEMISGMIAGLEEKLTENPGDKDGWQRLIRSYMVLGKKEEAARAIETALTHNGDDTGFAEAMKAAKAQLGQ